MSSTAASDASVNLYTSVTPKSSEHGGDLTYDANGNLTKREDSDHAPSRVYTYDFNNRLASATIDGETVRLRYDAMRRMVEKEWEDEPCEWIATAMASCGGGARPIEWTNSCTGEVITADEDHDGCEEDNTTLPDPGNRRVQYAYAGWRIMEERDPAKMDLTDGDAATNNDAPQKVYFYGSDSIDDVMILRVRGDVYTDAAPNPDYGWPSTDLYLAKDALGSTIALVSRDGNVVERYEYGDYGEPIILAPNGTTVRSESLYGNDVLFAGARWHADLGLYWMRNRWYDPYLGRFLTRDPIGAWGDPLNLGNAHAYAGNNPWSFVDPLGLCPAPGVLNGNGIRIVDGQEHHIVDNVDVEQLYSDLGALSPRVLGLIRLDSKFAMKNGYGDLFAFLKSDEATQEANLAHYDDVLKVDNIVLATHRAGEIANDINNTVGMTALTAGLNPALEVAGEEAIGQLLRGIAAVKARRAAGAVAAASTLSRGEAAVSCGGDIAEGQKLLTAELKWTGKIIPYNKRPAMSSIEHIIYAHGPQSGVAGTSKFNVGTTARDIKNMIDEAAKYGKFTWRPNGTGGGVTYSFENAIGTAVDGSPASRIQVYFNAAGEIQTAYPY